MGRMIRRLTVLAVAIGAMLAWASSAWAAFPGENGKMVFVSNRDGNAEVYVMNPDGTGQTRLTNAPFADSQPTFSPDGTKIAFFSNRESSGDIYIMNPDGTNQTRLTNAPFADGQPTFSPDGTKIAFLSIRDGNSEIYIMNADGTGQTRLTNNASSDEEPAFSPDGTKVAFMSNRDGNSEIYVMNADGTNQTRLTNNVSSDEEPAFSPDGTKIAFASNRDGGANFEIYSMNASGTGQTRITNNSSDDSQPDWQPINPDLSVLASDRPDPVEVGQNLTYSFAVANNGRLGANNVSLTARLPAGVEFVSASAGCTNTGSTVRCDLGDLATGASTTVEVTVKPIAEGTITTTVTVASSVRDADAMDNTDRETAQAIQAPTITSLSPAPDSKIRDRTPLIGATVSDAVTDLATSDINLFLDGRSITTFSYDASTDSLAYVSRKLTAGKHSVRVEATDAQGVKTSESWSFRIRARR